MNFKRITLVILINLLSIEPARAVHEYLKDKKLSAHEAWKLLRNCKSSDLPLILNNDVLFHMRRFLEKESGRKHIHESLKRMKRYAFLPEKLDEYNLPQALKAIPVIESGYQNIHSPHGWGSGLWMFIKPTARNYGLKINKRIDQRLNARLSTEAAMKYLRHNHRVFKDWHLALLAYNMGEFGVKKAMKVTRSKDAWTLIRKGHEQDKGYLAKVMAVMIIMNNPSILK